VEKERLNGSLLLDSLCLKAEDTEEVAVLTVDDAERLGKETENVMLDSLCREGETAEKDGACMDAEAKASDELRKKVEEADFARLDASKEARITSDEVERFKREKEEEGKARRKAEAEREEAREEARKAEAARIRAEQETARLKVAMAETACIEAERLAKLMGGDDEASLARINAAVVLRKVQEAEDRRKTQESQSVSSISSRFASKIPSAKSVASRGSQKSEVESKFTSNIPRLSTSSTDSKKVLEQSSSYQSEFYSCGANPGSVCSQDYLTIYMRSSEGGEEATIDLSDLSREEDYDIATMGSFSTQWSSGTKKYIFESTPAFAKHAKALHEQKRKANSNKKDGDDEGKDNRCLRATFYSVGMIAIVGCGATIAVSPKYRAKIASFDPKIILTLAKASMLSVRDRIHPEIIASLAKLEAIREQIHPEIIVSLAKASMESVRDIIQPEVIKSLAAKALTAVRNYLHTEKVVRFTVETLAFAKHHLRIGTK
jgi:hypothetical protein